MSLEVRNKAVEVIKNALETIHNGDNSTTNAANFILNCLLKGGFLAANVHVYAHEVEKDLNKLNFKCKVEE